MLGIASADTKEENRNKETNSAQYSNETNKRRIKKTRIHL